MIQGSCHCGAVSYEADAPLRGIAHCHCPTCRKTHAAAFSSIAAVPREQFRWIGGEEKLSRYESSPGKFRYFCSVCGSHLFAERPEDKRVMLAMGCVDNHLVETRQVHIWCSEGASWYDPDRPLPERPKGF